MSILKKRQLVKICCSCVILFVVLRFRYEIPGTSTQKVPVVLVAIVSCGEKRVPEALNTIKSALMFSRPTESLKFIIFCDLENQASVEKALKVLQRHKSFHFDLRTPTFPANKSSTWRNQFLPCATQRLFFPEILNEVDALLYVDSDTFFLSPPGETYQLFEKFTGSQIAGLVPNALTKNSWYPQNASFPFYGSFGLNTGVKLMNLTRMRSVNYQQELMDISRKYEKQLMWVDQDIVNIYFERHPEQIFEMPCEFNFRWDYCWKFAGNTSCEAPNGIKILHGSRQIFQRKRKIFGKIYDFLSNVSLNSDFSRYFNGSSREL
jgi:UDP-xylose:glucoside alpha-1,3-xylosyltransferase